MSNQGIHSIEEVNNLVEKTEMTQSEVDEILGMCNISSKDEITKE